MKQLLFKAAITVTVQSVRFCSRHLLPAELK